MSDTNRTPTEPN
jgi:hypothetical protein